MTLEEKVQEINKKLQPMLKEQGLIMSGLPYFPIYKILPVEVELALKVLEKYGVQYVVGFKENK